MKNTTRIALISLLLGSASYAAPFMAIGDGAELFLTGTLGVRVDDNIRLEKNAIDDVIFDINPGAELTFGKNAQLKGALTLVHSFTTYSDNSKYNTNLFSGDFVTKYDDAKLKLGFNAGFHELNQNTPDARGLARRDLSTIGGNGEVEVSQLTSVGAGLSFLHENYKRPDYDDKDELTVPIDFYYKYAPKLDVSVGYRYRDTDISGVGVDSTDHFFNVGARGEFSPKLTGLLKVGYGQRKLARGGNKDLFGADLSLAYEISPKTSLQIGGSNDFGTSPQGLQQENLTFNTSVETKLTTEWSVNGGISWRQIDYTTRKDDYWEFQLGTAYVINSNIRLVGGYVHRDYSSDISASEFKNNVFSVAANFRY